VREENRERKRKNKKTWGRESERRKLGEGERKIRKRGGERVREKIGRGREKK